MARELELAIQRSFFLLAAGTYEETCWRPAVDVYRKPNGWLVKFEIPGVDAAEVELIRCGNQLTVRGERRDWTIAEGARSYSMEICYSRFQRSLQLPESLDAYQVTTEYRDGMLLVRLIDVHS